MKNLLLLGALFPMLLPAMAEAQTTVPTPQRRTGIEVYETSRRSLRAELARTIKTYEQKGRKIAVKETLDGRLRFKTFADKTESIAPEYSASKTVYDDTGGFSLAEGFEGFADHIYDADALEWLPDGWTSINTHPNYDDPESLWYSWCITEPSITKDAPLNPESRYIAYIQYDEYENSDEWLITKPVTVKAEDYLFFDLSYIPYFLFYNFANLDDGINATLKVHISTDGGGTWTELLDVSQLEYSPEELEADNFRRFRIDISEYAGQTVLIAFQYVGVYGDSMQLDDVYVRPMLPTALYNRPQGTFLSGVNYMWETFATPTVFVPAFKQLQWGNYSNEALSSSWQTESGVQDTDNLDVTYSVGQSTVPILTATAGSREDTYQWNGTVTAGQSMNVGNLDQNCRLTILTYNDVPEPSNFVFGTCEADAMGYHVSTTAVFNVFDRPASPMLISGVDVLLETCQAPADAEFSLHAIAITDEGAMGDTLAVATITGADVVETDLGGYIGYGMHFEFQQEAGGTVMPVRLLIDQPMAYVLDGLDREGVVAGVVCNSDLQAFDAGAWVCRILSKEGEDDKVDMSSMGNYSLAMSLCDAVMPTIGAEPTITLPGTAGTKEIIVQSTMFMADGIDCTVADDGSWLTVGMPADRADGEVAIPLTYEALPDGVGNRSTALTVSTPYVDPLSIEVVQDANVVGLASASTAGGLCAVISAGGIEFLYAAGIRGALTIYDTGGTNVITTALSCDGRTLLPHQSLGKGIYVAVARYEDGRSEAVKFVVQ